MLGCQRDLFAIFDYIGCYTTNYKSRHIDRYADSRYNAKPWWVFLDGIQFQYLRTRLHDIDKDNG